MAVCGFLLPQTAFRCIIGEAIMLVVSYLSDYAREYTIGLRECATLERLREFSMHWASLTNDAWEIVRKMNDRDFGEYWAGARKERRGTFAGEAWAVKYGAILMPELLLRVSLVAMQYGAPWGTAFLQCQRAGLIERRGDVYVWVEPVAQKAERHE
jgi:hypothetical protein